MLVPGASCQKHAVAVVRERRWPAGAVSVLFGDGETLKQ